VDIQHNKPYENIITIAMRGKIDTSLSEIANITLLEKLVVGCGASRKSPPIKQAKKRD
jgi:hypothetical protein